MSPSPKTCPALEAALARHDAADPTPLATTPAARLYRVTSRHGPAILKLYPRGHAGNEAPAAALMAAWGPPMVRIHAHAADSLLMEPLDGPSLGELSRKGQDHSANALLAATARALHASHPAATPSLTPLASYLAPLFDTGFDRDCPNALRDDITTAQSLARSLLDNSPQPVPLHGDLHHDNVILTPNGPRAFDAKGLLGDPAFELANALRNPKGLPKLLRTPRRLATARAEFAKALDVPEPRLAAWAAVKCAHSIALRARGPVTTDPEADLLALLLSDPHIQHI